MLKIAPVEPTPVDSKPETLNTQDDNPLFDIIQNLQSKLSNVPSNNSSNFTPEPIASQNDSSEFNLNNVINLLNGVGKNKTNNENTTASINNAMPNLSNLNIDIGTIAKFQKFFTSMNKNDPRKNLLTSLKPFLRETRQKNIDTYITLLGVISALDIFTNKGSD